MKRVFLAALAVAIVLAFAIPVVSQDMPNKETQKSEMKVSTAPIKQIACDPACGFVVQGRNEKELISIVKHHMKMVHKMNLTDAQIKEKVTELPPK